MGRWILQICPIETDMKKGGPEGNPEPPFVREGGLEPPHLSAYAPETYASTNSAIPAIWNAF